MAEKKGAGGKPQAYDESTGQYGNGTSETKYRQNTSYEDIIGENKKSTLTSQEKAMWYERVGGIKRLKHWAPQTKDGCYLIKIENKDDHKLVFTSGTYAKPKVEAVYAFDSSDEIDDFIMEMAIYGKMQGFYA